MPITGLTVGRDITVTLNDNNGLVTTCRVKKFTAKQKTSSKESAGLNGINLHMEIPMGWDGSFEMDRNNSNVDDYFHELENLNYYLGNPLVPLTLTQTVTESNGSTSQYQFNGVVITYEDAGNYTADDYVTLRVGFKAQQRIKLA